MHPAPGTVLDGKYALVRQLGAGGAGAVHEAEHLIVGKRVAVKVLHPSLARDRAIRMSFVGEARAAAQIGHANVVDVYDLGVSSDGLTYMVMELLQGETLDAVIRERGALGPEYACELMLQVLAGLDAAHREGIVHRDLKPANVIVTHPRPDRPLAKVLDFGIAKGVADAIAEDGVGDAVYGTPAYMAPEQTAAGPVDARADVYSAAVMLFEMLTGQDAVDGGSPTEVMMNALLGKHRSVRDSNPGVPLKLARIVERAMSRDPEDRPASARELAAELRPFVAPERALSLGPAPGTTVAPIPLIAPGAGRVAATQGFTLPGPAPDLVSVRCPPLSLPGLASGLAAAPAGDVALRLPSIPKAPHAPQPADEPPLQRSPSVPVRGRTRTMGRTLRACVASCVGLGLGGALGWVTFPWWH